MAGGADGAAFIRGRYEPLGVAGRGGQGEVLRALDRQHDRTVALKIRGAGRDVDREAILREVRILLGLLPHPSLPLVRDDFFLDDRHVMVMDWVDGEDLASILRRSGEPGLPPTMVVAALAEVAAALDHLHTHDPTIVHQDVKPANVIRTEDGRVVLVDFGVSSTTGGSASAGTLGFRAPELAVPGGVSPAADVYGLAATAFALLTGRKPGPAAAGAWDALPAPAVIERTIRRALSTDPARRQPSASALIEELRAWLVETMPSGVVTLMLTDVSGSTRAWEEYPGAMARALELHDHVIAETVARHGGSLVKQRGEGDSAFAVFPHAADAAGCAAAVQQRFARERWPTPTPLRVRIALHTGRAQRRDRDYFGPVVNRCARLRSIAHGGQTVLTAATADLIRAHLPAGCTLTDHGRHRLRDLARPEHVLELSLEGAEPFPALRSLDRMRHNLPVQLTSFVGREHELAEVRDLLDATRLVTLTGVGGVGKTRLALQVGADLLDATPDGVVVVELAPVVDPRMVQGEVIRALGEDARGADPRDAIVAALRGKRMLAILDNCEHVIDEAAHLADAVLRGCPDLRIIATSREPLSVPGEAVYRVPSLPTPDPQALPDHAAVIATDAGRLFAERATLARPGADLGDADAVEVARIVRRLDGIPLAIELAAAALRTRTIAEVAAGLDDRFEILTGGARTTLQRQRTLRAALDWSHDLLGDAERAVLRRASAFVGGFEAADARAVCAGGDVGEDIVEDVLATLADKSLLTRAADGRYAMLETVRAYAAEALAAAGERDETFRRHLEVFQGLVRDSGVKAFGPEQGRWLARFRVEGANIAVAVERAADELDDPQLAMNLVAGAYVYWETSGRVDEARALAEPIMTRCGDGHPGDRGIWNMVLGRLAMLDLDYDAARTFYREALTLLDGLASDELTVGRASSRAESYKGLAEVEILTDGDLEEAERLLERCGVLRQELDDSIGLAHALHDLGFLKFRRAHLEEAIALLEEAAAVFEREGERVSAWPTIHTLARIDLRLGREERARERSAEALELARTFAVTPYEFASLGQAVDIALHAGDAAEARARLEDLERRGPELHATYPTPQDLRRRANVAVLEGDDAAAIAALEQAVVGPVGEVTGRARIELAMLHLRDGRPADAAESLRPLAAMSRAAEANLSSLLTAIGALGVADGAHADGSVLLHAAGARARARQEHWPQWQRAFARDAGERARAALGQEAFEAARARADALGEEAVARLIERILMRSSAVAG